MSRIPDNYDLFEQHDAAQQRAEQQLPKCDYCYETIQDEYFYDLDGVICCSECLDSNHRKRVEDYAG